jgi:beta-1,4-mannosyl-glycoprotein beta-1,4-N-acetylglucosaminyltransferase
LLDIRLHHLDEIVDYFVITEAKFTHAGNPKPLFFKDNRHLFAEFDHKIIHHVVDTFPPELSTFERDWFQRNAVKPLLDAKLNSDDILIYGDVDELPSIAAVKESIRNLGQGAVMNHLAQDLFYYFVNLEETSGTLLSNMGEFPGVTNKKWLGTTVSSWTFSKNFAPTDLRSSEHVDKSTRIADGGFHFSYVGGPVSTSAEVRVRAKLKESAHQELNVWRTNSFLKGRLSRGKDIFGRRGARFKKRSDLSYLPEYLLDNLDKYESLIQK